MFAIIAYLVIAAIYEAIKKAVSNRRQRRLDEIVRQQFGEFDFAKERQEIQSIAARFDFARVEEKLNSVSAEHESPLYRCPRCGGMLVERNGKYGKFLGCEHYPKCLYTRNM